MANSRSKSPLGGAGLPGSSISTGLPGLTTTDATTEELLEQTAQLLVDNLTSVGSGLSMLNSLQQQQASAVEANTAALEQNTQGRSGALSSTLESAASGILGGSGLLSPLLSGIMSLFGRSSSPQTTVPQPFSLPAPINIQGTVSASAVPGQSAAPAATPSATSVTVQVNAMDSRSFIDHQDDIANAVREAVLHSHALNDVLAQL